MPNLFQIKEEDIGELERTLPQLADALMPILDNRLRVQLADGRTLVREVEFPRGHALNPMSDAEVEQKFRRLVEPRYGKERADRILAACWDLENLKNASDLIRLVS